MSINSLNERSPSKDTTNLRNKYTSRPFNREKLSEELKGVSLVEFIEKFASPTALTQPKKIFSLQEASYYRGRLPKGALQSKHLATELKKIQTDTCLTDETLGMFFTHEIYTWLKSGISGVVSPLKIMYAGDPSSIAKLVFEEVSRYVPYAPLLLMFPPEANGAVETFGLDREIRFRMVDHFVHSINRPEDLEALATHLADAMPYFRDLPTDNRNVIPTDNSLV